LDAPWTDPRSCFDPARFLPVEVGRSKLRLIAEAWRVEPKQVVQRAERIAAGRFRLFSAVDVDLPDPVPWHRNPQNGAEWPTDVHWCDLDLFTPERGDVKGVWELSRFSWAFDLARGYLWSANAAYAEVFWRRWESWLAANPPNLGVHWVSGQECALRLMAWCFATFAFLPDPSSTNDRLSRMLVALHAHGRRIAGFIGHAVRQKTNHAVTEAAGLLTLGLLFPCFPEAAAWRRQGRDLLEREGRRQIYPDGTYVQHSMNYHRLVLHTYAWCLALAERAGEAFSPGLRERLASATEFLYQMQDETTGRVPNYGPNDGALFLRLDECDYVDYRPAIAAARRALGAGPAYPPGPWDEASWWLFGPEKSGAAGLARPKRPSSAFVSGGYFTLRTGQAWGLVRAHTYRGRVGH